MGKYELLGLLGKGGMGEVWKARDTELNRVVALKLLQRTSPEDLARFRREAHAVARLNHPNVAPLFDFSENPPYLAMQFVEGEPIAKPEHLASAARAVHYAHGQGILHRDLKPANILVDAAGRAYVLDFGLAREVRTDATAMSLTGDILGTPSYMSPEQARGEVKSLDARTDVYGLGATLYMLLEGRPPHVGPTAYEVIRRVIEEDPPAPRGDLGIIAMKAMEKDPARRYASAAEFADDLDRFLRNEPIVARPASVGYRLRKRIQRQPLVWGLSTLLALALLGGAGFALVQRERQLRLAWAQGRIDDARSRLEEVRTALYVEGCSLAPYEDACESVRADCRGVLRRIPGFVPAWYWIGVSHRIEGDFDAAVEALQRAVELDPEARYAWAELGRAYVEQGLAWTRSSWAPQEGLRSSARSAIENAAAAFQRAGEPEAGIAGFQVRAYAAWIGGRLEELREVAAGAAARFEGRPGVEEFEFLLGLLEDDPDRLAHLARAIEIRPGYLLAYLNRGNLYQVRGDPAAAERDFDDAVRLQPRFWGAWMNRGNARDAMGRPQEALEDLLRAAALNPHEPTVHFNLGNVRARLGDLDGAAAEYDETLRLEPRYAEARHHRGIVRRRQGDDARALEDFNAALALRPGLAEAWNNRGGLFAAAGETASAARDFDEAIRLDPANADFRCNRGIFRSAQDDVDGALEDFSEAIARQPGHWTALLERGGLLYRLQRYAEAEADLTAALRVLPASAEAYNARAKARSARGNLEGALADFGEAIRLDGENPWYRANRAMARRASGDLPGAIEDLRAALARAPADWPPREAVASQLRALEAAAPDY